MQIWLFSCKTEKYLKFSHTSKIVRQKKPHRFTTLWFTLPSPLSFAVQTLALSIIRTPETSIVSLVVHLTTAKLMSLLSDLRWLTLVATGRMTRICTLKHERKKVFHSSDPERTQECVWSQCVIDSHSHLAGRSRCRFCMNSGKKRNPNNHFSFITRLNATLFLSARLHKSSWNAIFDRFAPLVLLAVQKNFLFQLTRPNFKFSGLFQQHTVCPHPIETIPPSSCGFAGEKMFFLKKDRSVRSFF